MLLALVQGIQVATQGWPWAAVVEASRAQFRVSQRESARRDYHGECDGESDSEIAIALLLSEGLRRKRELAS